jgi:hypothetical protein
LTELEEEEGTFFCKLVFESKDAISSFSLSIEAGSLVLAAVAAGDIDSRFYALVN